ncbi:MAG: DUF1643 domain-containing protein [Nanoarchaeota archaeon]|nr:DUF1643 domain-containing protein [Nanoarchaeota archaeon]
MKKDAVISKCGKYRYLLTRAWDSSKPGMLYIGLNPSTADDKKDDPTIRRAIQYAKDWGFGSLSVCNLFAFRATLPSDLKKAKDPVGKENDLWLMRESLRAEKIVAGWGNHGSFLNRSFEVRNLLGRLNHLGLTKTGEPKHPLYLRKDLKPIGFV